MAFALGASKVLSKDFFLFLSRMILPVLAMVGGIILWRQVMDNPTQYQLVGLGLYGGFMVIPAIWRSK